MAPMPIAQSKLKSFIFDASELVYAYRGIGWDYGTGAGLYVPPDWRNTADRDIFLRQTLHALARNYIILDVLNTALSSFPGGNATGVGRSIFGHGSNLVEGFLISTVLHCMTGFFLYRGKFPQDATPLPTEDPTLPCRIRVRTVAAVVRCRGIQEGNPI